MANKPGEHKTVQARILRYAEEIGWSYVLRNDAEKRRVKGRVLSIGTNEVAKAGGGQYWQGDEGDGRDYEYSSIDLPSSRSSLSKRLGKRTSTLEPDAPIVFTPSLKR